MNARDDVLLDYLYEIHPSAAPPTPIHWNIHNRREELLDKHRCEPFSKNTTRNRLRKLEKAGFVRIAREDSKYREITEEGIEYIQGERDAPELDD